MVLVKMDLVVSMLTLEKFFNTLFWEEDYSLASLN
jgi:hypothetical protein